MKWKIGTIVENKKMMVSPYLYTCQVEANSWELAIDKAKKILDKENSCGHYAVLEISNKSKKELNG